MNQTTRCPTCQTRFKVVADQLRISDGWVRCGHCQQVFDATLSLQPAEPEAMLPDMPLDQLRGPVARAVARTPEARTWGSSVASHRPVAPSSPEPEEDGSDDFAPTQPGQLEDELQERPTPWTAHVPSFLKAPLPRVNVFPSRPAEPPPVAVPSAAPPSHAHPSAPAETVAAPAEPMAAPTAPPLAGYELPAPQDDDSDSGWPALFDEPVVEKPATAEVPELDLAHFIAELSGTPAPAAKASAAAPLPEEDDEDETQAAALDEDGPALEPEPEPEPELNTDPAPEVNLRPDPDLHWALVSDDASPLGQEVAADSAAPASSALGDPAAPHRDGAAGHSSTLDELELSFVRNAQRRAFWSGAGVRAGLGALALLLLLGLAGQVALQERARLAALWPQSRAAFEAACAYLRCSVGLHRDIAAVAVEGSSFNRTQGDRYQFSLSLRNRSGLPVEAPAIELTLTDADDRPVLRRVLSPADLAAPNPLRAGQEWNTVLPMAIGQGGARIAGYRVLAFYP